MSRAAKQHHDSYQSSLQGISETRKKIFAMDAGRDREQSCAAGRLIAFLSLKVSQRSEPSEEGRLCAQCEAKERRKSVGLTGCVQLAMDCW